MSTLTLEAGQARDTAAARGHRAPVYGPGTFNGAVLAEPHYIGRERPEPGDVVIHEHGIAGAIIRTHRTVRTSPAGWVYQIRRGDWCEVGYTRTQREALQVAVGRLCRAVDSGEVCER